MASLYAPQILALPVEASTDAASASNAETPVNDISDFYSDINMRVHLASKANDVACSGEVCLSNQIFDAQVQAIGQSLAKSAYEIYPELKKKTPKFEFSVADKKDLGSASNGSGKVVIFRGVQHLDLGDDALSFLVAREMGHVIGRHHNSNAKTKLLFTVLTGVLFPAVSILSASSAAAQVSTATTVLTSAASTATSFFGSEVAIARIKPTQLSEADDISIVLIADKGLTKSDLAQSLAFIVEKENANAWEKDLYQSIGYVQNLAGEPVETTAEIEPLPEDALVMQANIDAPLQPEINSEKTPINLVLNDQAVTEEKRPVEAQTLQVKPIEPKPVEIKSAEKPKVILITNETLAASQPKAIKPTDAANRKSKVEKSNQRLTGKKKISQKIATKSTSTKKQDVVKTSAKNAKKLSTKTQAKKT